MRHALYYDIIMISIIIVMLIVIIIVLYNYAIITSTYKLY